MFLIVSLLCFYSGLVNCSFSYSDCSFADSLTGRSKFPDCIYTAFLLGLRKFTAWLTQNPTRLLNTQNSIAFS